MEGETLKWLSSLGVGGAIAGMIFLYYRMDTKVNADYLRAQIELWRGQSDALLQVVKENTKAITANTDTIQALHRREDRTEEALGKLGFSFAPHRQGDRP